MTPGTRAQYLKKLGIVTYVPRLPTSPLPEPFLLGTCDAPSTRLIFFFQSDYLDWSSAAHQLLQKIIAAVGFGKDAVALCYFPTTPFALPKINPSARIIAFGAGLTVSLPQGSVETVTLTELQHDDVAKRALWQELKAIKALYGH